MEGATLPEIRATVRGNLIQYESYYEKGWLNTTTREGSLVMRAEGSIEGFLRVVHIWLCANHGSLMLHASGVIRNGSGYVFFGPSGSGKTTVASLSKEDISLCDEFVIIRKVANGYRVYGVPFFGYFPDARPTNASAPLSGLFTLVKDSKHHVEPIARSEAVGRLVASVPLIREQVAKPQPLLEICEDLEAHVQVRALHFSKDPGFWRVIDGIE